MPSFLTVVCGQLIVHSVDLDGIYCHGNTRLGVICTREWCGKQTTRGCMRCLATTSIHFKAWLQNFGETFGGPVQNFRKAICKIKQSKSYWWIAKEQSDIDNEASDRLCFLGLAWLSTDWLPRQPQKWPGKCSNVHFFNLSTVISWNVLANATV